MELTQQNYINSYNYVNTDFVYNIPMSDLEAPEKITELPLSLVRNMIMLATSGFGLVVALAWNDFVKKIVESYIDPYFGKSSGIASQFIYAFTITFIAILVMMQLTFLQKRIENLHEKVTKRT